MKYQKNKWSRIENTRCRVSLLNNLKNIYLYWYYECYMQTDRWYKDYELKKIYGVCTLNIILSLTIFTPFIILYHKVFQTHFSKYLIGGISLVFSIFTFYIIGKGDITEKINSYYKDKEQLKKAKFYTKIAALICSCIWILAISYKYGEL